MTYARWSDSNWFVFWPADSHSLSIWHIATPQRPEWPYDMLKHVTFSELCAYFDTIPTSDVIELLDYIEEFIQDFERDKSS